MFGVVSKGHCLDRTFAGKRWKTCPPQKLRPTSKLRRSNEFVESGDASPNVQFLSCLDVNS